VASFWYSYADQEAAETMVEPPPAVAVGFAVPVEVTMPGVPRITGRSLHYDFASHTLTIESGV
jgi:hypothetical protein